MCILSLMRHLTNLFLCHFSVEVILGENSERFSLAEGNGLPPHLLMIQQQNGAQEANAISQ